MTEYDRTKVPPRAVQQDEGLEYAEFSIRVMERFFDAIANRAETAGVYNELFSAYMDLLQDELAPHAFDLAYELFSQDKVAKKRRRERERLNPR